MTFNTEYLDSPEHLKKALSEALDMVYRSRERENQLRRRLWGVEEDLAQAVSQLEIEKKHSTGSCDVCDHLVLEQLLSHLNDQIIYTEAAETQEGYERKRAERAEDEVARLQQKVLFLHKQNARAERDELKKKLADAARQVQILNERIATLEEENSNLSWTVSPDRMGQ